MTFGPARSVAVLDSSVLVPAWSRVVLQRLAASPSRPYIPVWSEWIIAETWRVLTWQWIARTGRAGAIDSRRLSRAANAMLSRMLDVMSLVSLHSGTAPATWPQLRDENDAPIWQTAVLANARYVVSHNMDDFPPLVDGRHAYEGVEYLTTIEFVEDVLGEDPTALLGADLPASGALRSRRTSSPNRR